MMKTSRRREGALENLPEPQMARYLNRIYVKAEKEVKDPLIDTLNTIVSMIYENAIKGYADIETMINDDVSGIVVNRFRELGYRVSKNKPNNGLVDIRIKWKG